MRKNMFSSIASQCFIMFFLQLPINSQSDVVSQITDVDIDENIKRAYFSTRVIFNIETDTRGTGFIIDEDGWMITARHVMERIFGANSSDSIVAPDRIKLPTTIIYSHGNELGVINQYFTVDNKNNDNLKLIFDLALVKIHTFNGGKNVSINYTPALPQKIVIGSDIGIIGSTIFPVPNKYLKFSPKPVIKKGIISCYEPGIHRFSIDANVVMGDSGGPVIDFSSGKLIGIVVSIETQPFEGIIFREIDPNSPSASLEIENLYLNYPDELIKKSHLSST